jgi:nitroreductase
MKISLKSTLEVYLHQENDRNQWRLSTSAGVFTLLQANAFSLGTVMIGAFDDKQVKEILGIKEEPLYVIPVGKI